MRELSYPRKFPAFSPLIMFDAGGKSTYPLDCFGAFADEFRGFEIIVFHDVVSHRWVHIMNISTLQRVRILLAFLSSLSALPWSLSRGPRL